MHGVACASDMASTSSCKPFKTSIFIRAARRVSGFGIDFVKISAAMSQERTYANVKFSHSYCSCNHATDTRRVRGKRLMVGFRPVLRIHNIAWLSPRISTELIPKTSSHRGNSGIVIILIVVSIATISDSGVERETQPCRLDMNERGTEQPFP